MPEWTVHDKWAKQLGIPGAVSRFINLLIDKPQKNQEYMDFCNRSATIYRGGKPTKMNAGMVDHHDSGRNNPVLATIHLKFLRKKGNEYVMAWYLHQTLDYLKSWVNLSNEINPIPPIEDILTDKRIRKKIGDPQDPIVEAVRTFVVEHSGAILQDL